MIQQEESLERKILEDLTAIVGVDFVFFDDEILESYSRSTLSKGTRPQVIIKPKNTTEVQKIVKVALFHRLKIHPISTGKNWGYSDACAPTDNTIILDLGRMNRIVEVNEEMCYATIEPGVTQGQLYSFLKEKKVNLWMDATGAGMDTSIIGNIAERGFGHSPYGDRYAHSCAYEVVLPTGELLHTGFGHYKNSKVSELYKWGVGPSLDGLFTQSNFGIITRVTVWLMPKPEDFKVLFFVLENEDDIIQFIEKIRPLKIDGTIQSTVHISNDVRTLSTLQRFPFKGVKEEGFLSKKERKELRGLYHMGFWVGTIGFYGSKDQTNASVKKIKNRLRDVKGVKYIVVFDDFRMRLFKKILPVLNRFGLSRKVSYLYKKIEISFSLLQGKTPNSSILGGLWRVKNKNDSMPFTSSNPLDYGSGFYWISPILPMRGDDIKAVTTLVEPIFNKHNFDLMQTLSMVSERSLCSVMTICFDKKNEMESLMAEKCHDEVVETLIRNGYVLYRSGNQTMKHLLIESEGFFDFLKKIKKTIDPASILSSGKYIPED